MLWITSLWFVIGGDAFVILCIIDKRKCRCNRSVYGTFLRDDVADQLLDLVQDERFTRCYCPFDCHVITFICKYVTAHYCDDLLFHPSVRHTLILYRNRPGSWSRSHKSWATKCLSQAELSCILIELKSKKNLNRVEPIHENFHQFSKCSTSDTLIFVNVCNSKYTQESPDDTRSCLQGESKK